MAETGQRSMRGGGGARRENHTHFDGSFCERPYSCSARMDEGEVDGIPRDSGRQAASDGETSTFDSLLFSSIFLLILKDLLLDMEISTVEDANEKNHRSPLLSHLYFAHLPGF